MTTPTPTPADQLRAAAEKLRAARFSGAITATPTVAALIGARLPLAAWLEAEAAPPITAQHSDRCTDPQCTTLAALAVARQILGTTESEGAATDPAADRRARYAAAVARGKRLDFNRMAAYERVLFQRRNQDGIDAVMAVADSEIAADPAAPPAPADRAAVREETVLDLGRDLLRDGLATFLHRLVGPQNASRILLSVTADDAAAGVQPPTESEDTASDDTLHACPGRWAGPNCRCFDDEPATPPAAPAAPEEPAS
ncbi:hypothetical protein [Streptomyces halstedii]|uniref:hypothetical protein n=1 Tax=Streptomyces halstedii TaxID=1944 RepID=UPI00364810D5